MNKHFKLISISAFAFVLGLGVNNFAMSEVPSSFKVAVVDVQKVVSASKQVNDLKKSQSDKMKDLQASVEAAQKAIAAEKDNNKKKELIKKYDNDITYKKNTIDKNYAKQIADIDKSITKTIQTESKKTGYDLVLAKGVVLYGGTDITGNIVKIVK